MPTSPRPHAPLTVGGQGLSWDANDNMAAGLRRTLDYDMENRPVAITQGGVTASFTYGPDGERFRKVRIS